MNATKITITQDKRNKNRPWSCRWWGEFDPHTGRQTRLGESFRLKVEAEQFAAKKTIAFAKGQARDRSPNISLQGFCKDWVKTRRSELREATKESYQNTIDRLVDFFGATCSLREIDPRRAAAFISEQKSKKIKHLGEEISESTREQVKRNCKCLFTTAVEWGLLSKNPFTKIRSKKIVPKRWHRVTPQEYRGLLDAAGTLRQKVAYALLYTCGIRSGEAFSLTWSDVDFENGRLIISNREATSTLPPFHVKDSEARRIPLPQHTIDLLTSWQQQAPEGVPYILLTKDRLEIVKAHWQKLRKAGKEWRNRYMVNNVLRNFKAHCKLAGIKPVGKLTVHTLRKSCGQNWADHLPMNVVKELMGHSSISTTQEYYTQVDSDHEAKAARVIDSLLRENDVERTYEKNLSAKVR